MPYYILKTGMPMYDLERTYGLGLIVNVLTTGETKVFDKGLYYEIKGDLLDYSSIEKKESEILSLVAENIESWDNALQTTHRAAREKKKRKASDLLKRYCKDILSYYSSISQPERKPKELLTAPLELASTKGFREEIRCRKYDEGKGFEIPEEDWVLTIIGALHSVIWQFVPEKENVAIIPSPDEIKGVDASHLRDIKEFLKVKGMNRVSTVTLIAHSAIKLHQELWNRRQDPNPWMDSFTSFVYGSLVGTAQQSKPKVGGYFSLELFEKLLEVGNGVDVLDHFDYIFRIGNFQGQEALSINFAEFLAKPGIENYSKFMSIYLKTILRKERGIKRPNKIIWQEVIKYVKD